MPSVEGVAPCLLEKKIDLCTLCTLTSGHRMVRLSVDDLVAEAVEAFKNNECIEEPPELPAIPVRRVFLSVILHSNFRPL